MRLYVPLSRAEFDQLLERARAERRRPQDQAAVLLAAALGVAPSTTPAAEQAPATLPVKQTPRDGALAEAGAR